MQSQTSARRFWDTFGMCSSEILPLQSRARCTHRQEYQEEATVLSFSLISLFMLSLTLTSPDRIWEWRRHAAHRSLLVTGMKKAHITILTFIWLQKGFTIKLREEKIMERRSYLLQRFKEQFWQLLVLMGNRAGIWWASEDPAIMFFLQTALFTNTNA